MKMSNKLTQLERLFMASVGIIIVLCGSFAYSQEVRQLQTKTSDVTQPTQVNIQPLQLQSNPYALTYEQETALRQLLSPVQMQRVTDTARKIATGSDIRSLNASWNYLIEDLARQGSPVDINSLIQRVLSESYQMMNNDLRRYEDKVRMFHDLVARLRETLKQLRGELMQLQEQYRRSWIVRQRAEIREKIAQLESQISVLEAKILTTEHDAELANIDLQNALQKKQQILQTLSNVSKLLHDTAMAIIRKVG
jgi:chromosome segregation ATPase